ncbi:MAG TPA: hypothetical protein QF433_00510, partial [Candidatus Thalassarchaeaceae archaeon]|nr:hypothetical protein [Candidatus Thalassarchaeaceae archaeon]
MDAFIRMVPGWENLLLGVQTGVWAALIGIFIVGIIARQLLIYLFPLIMKPITGKVDSVNEFEMRSRVSFGAAIAGWVWGVGIDNLSEYSLN